MSINQKIRVFAVNKADEIIQSKKKRIELSIVRLVQEHIYNRTYNNLDWGGNSFKSYTPKYKEFKERYLKGQLKGRGGKPSLTKARLDRRKSLVKGGNSSARSVNDKMRLTGLMLNRLRIKDFNIFKQRGSDRQAITFTISVEGSDIQEQVEGLAKNGYNWLGFKNRNLPSDLMEKIRKSVTRIVND